MVERIDRDDQRGIGDDMRTTHEVGLVAENGVGEVVQDQLTCAPAGHGLLAVHHHQAVCGEGALGGGEDGGGGGE